jgi:3-oxoacyl-[acyl-carrier-protein] synthase II
VRRDGFVYSPGAAIMFLERDDLARARGARIYGEIAGGASTNDAHHLVQQSGTGAIECMRLALADAGLAPEDIAHVNAHGSATVANDQVEADAINEVFATVESGHRPSVTSIKGVTGHSLGASGSYEALSVLLSFVHGELAPAGVDLQYDEKIGLDIVAGAPRPWTPGPTLSNSFGLGGQNGTMVLVPAGG